MNRLVFTLLLVAAPSAVLGDQVPLSLREISTRCEHIVVGRVTAMKSYPAVWPGLGPMTFTDVTLKVLDLWKGKLESTELVLQIPGGKNPDGSVLHVSEAPRFEVGEKVLVFTYRKHQRTWVYGWEQGKYRVISERVIGRRDGPIREDSITAPLKHEIRMLLREKR